MVLRILFAIWAMAVAALSVMSHPGSKDLLMAVKVTSSGFVVHGVAYFVGILLCYFSFNKKNISFVLWSGLLIFLFSVVLEVVQFYLPNRTFNVYDVVANGVGILFFVVFISHRHRQTNTDFFLFAQLERIKDAIASRK
jgi:glycopeptide antibiotics resistance protein